MSFDPLSGRPQDGGDALNLVQLVYRSVSTSGVTSALQMSDILSEARVRNVELGITGALTAVDGQFVQIIEGPAPGIDALLAKLVGDARHKALTILERRTVTTRAFGDWEMISPRLAGLEAAQLALLLSTQTQEIDAYVPVFQAAIRRQDAILKGLESPVSAAEQPSYGLHPSHRTNDLDT